MPAALPTKKTLVFPTLDRAEREWRSEIVAAGIPAPRPSERPTVPSLPPVDDAEEGTSNTEVIELSASALETGPLSLDDAAPSIPTPSAAPSSSRLATRLVLDPARDGEARRRAWERVRARMRSRKVLGRLVAASVVLGVLAFAAGYALAPSPVAAAPRFARSASEELTPLAQRASEGAVLPPAGGCTAGGPSRMLAARAHIPTGLDVSVLDAGFGIGFAASTASESVAAHGIEAIGIRLDASLLRGGDRVRVKGSAPVKHVAVDAASGDDGDGDIDLRIDTDDARTVLVEGEGSPVRVRATGPFVVVARQDGATKTAWAVPGFAGAAANARGARSAPPLPVDVRAARRDGGGVAVVLRRGASMWVGLLDHDLRPEGPLVPLARAGATIGMPSVTALGGGAAIAWAERKLGDKEWNVVVASVGGPDDDARQVRVLTAGMSPSIAAMPDGDVLLAYAVGGAGAHRVVARRLGRDLAARGDAVVVSPEDVNAGQPAAAVAGDGRGVVAFFGASTGRAAVLATPLVCDPGI